MVIEGKTEELLVRQLKTCERTCKYSRTSSKEQT
jgi:hypothetical protein